MPIISKRHLLKLIAAAPYAAYAGPAPLIFWSDLRQTIDGFGASGAFRQTRNLQALPEGPRGRILDLLFSPERGAGLSITRNIVGDGGAWGTPANGPTPTIEPQPGVWDWRGDEDQIWYLREAERRGCTRHVSTVWSPPAWMKDNASVVRGGRVKPERYRAYAEYLSAYVRGYREHHGIAIYAISPTNEPSGSQDYSSCLWTGEDLRTLVRDHIAPVFARDDVTAKLILGEDEHWREAPYAPALADPAAAGRVDIVAAHAYAKANQGFEPLALRTGDLPLARAAGKPVWQTEVSCFGDNDPSIDDALYWATLIHTHLVENNVSAWFYWWAVRDADRRNALITFDGKTSAFVAAKRLFAMGQYARFVRPGFRRVATPSRPLPDVWLSAFRGPDTAVAVAINTSQQVTAIVLPLPGRQIAVYRTSRGEDLKAITAIDNTTGAAKIDLAPRSITSFVTRGGNGS